MLNEFERNRVWEDMLAAEARALYFGDLTSRYTRLKQIITGASFFLSSGAAAAVIGKLPLSVPLILSVAVAAAAAYSMAVNLDGKIWTMAKLFSAWSSIAHEYARLWAHIGDQDAEERLDKIIEMEREPSELATTEAPNDQKLMGKWQDRVFAMYHLAGERG